MLTQILEVSLFGSFCLVLKNRSNTYCLLCKYLWSCL